MIENDVHFTITATNRPKTLNKTLQSFCNNLKNFDISKSRIYINIDPLPNANHIEEVIKVAQKYCPNIIGNMPSQPNFTAAINWLWSKVQSKYVFHLEDDWVLFNTVCLNKALKLLENKNCVQYIFRAYRNKYAKMPLSPSIIKLNLIKNIAGKLDTDINPEIQLRRTKITGMNITDKNLLVSGEKIIIKDIGREWLSNQAFKKPSQKKQFNSWLPK